MKRSQRQLARVRESQPNALTPSLYHESPPAPTTPHLSEDILPKGTCPLCVDRVTAAFLALDVDAKCDIKALERKCARLESTISDLQRERDEEKRILAEERAAHDHLKLDYQALYTRYRETFTKTASEHKAALLDAVKNGEFCSNAAASHEDIKQEIEKGETLCQTK